MSVLGDLFSAEAKVEAAYKLTDDLCGCVFYDRRHLLWRIDAEAGLIQIGVNAHRLYGDGCRKDYAQDGEVLVATVNDYNNAIELFALLLELETNAKIGA